MFDITANAMLVRVSLSVWSAIRTDKAAGETVAQAHHVDGRKAGKYRKNCIDVTAPEYRDVAIKAAGAVKEALYTLTLPTQDKGVRILKASAHPEFCERYRKASDAFWAAYEIFELAYPRLVQEARITLNGLFNPLDYPDDIRSKFGLRVSFAPMPAGANFVVDMQGKAEIQAQIDADVEEAVATAMRDPYQRLYDAIARAVNRLSDPKAVFHDTLIGNIADLVQILPALNITGDPQLESLRCDAQRLIAGVSAQQLRDDPVTRATVAQEAAAIERSMAAFMA